MRLRVPLILIAGVLSFAAGCGKHPPKPVTAVEPTPGDLGQPASGRSAIAAPQGNALITAEQVRSYVTSHRLPHGHATNLAIVSTSLTTNQQVRTVLHGANLGLPDEEPMWLVVMSGNFAFSAPPGVTPRTFPVAVEVFDARTGKLLQAGGLPRAPEAVGTR